MALKISISGVRGIVGPDLNPAVVGEWVVAFHQILPPGPIAVGRDSRSTGAELAHVACGYLAALGREVEDLGIVPTPTVQLAVEKWGAAGGLILSASHNPRQWNALKLVDSGGAFLSPERFELLKRAKGEAAESYVGVDAFGLRRARHRDAIDLHRRLVRELVDREAIRAAGITAVIECGHGAGGTLLPAVAADLGVSAQILHEEPTGELLDRPEPTEETLSELSGRISGRPDLVAMTDPDADRLGLALPGTGIVGEEWTLPLVCRYRLREAQGPLVTNLSTSTRIEVAAREAGVPVFRTPVGEAHVVEEMKRRDALIGGEGNGGVIDPRVHLGRDSAVAFALLCGAQAALPGGAPRSGRGVSRQIYDEREAICSRE